MAIEHESRHLERSLRAKDESTKSMASNRVRKLVIYSLYKRIGAAFNKWRSQHKRMCGQEEGAYKIQRKIRTRLLRIAWNRYRLGCLNQE